MKINDKPVIIQITFDDKEGHHFVNPSYSVNYGIIEIANILGLTERKASNRTHEGLARLAIYYGYTKVHNTIRGQGTKNQGQKVPKMGS